jgi:hypothetical protein
MTFVLKILARLGLVLTTAPAFLFLFGQADLEEVKMTMITGTGLWLLAVPRVQKLKELDSLNLDTQDHI